MSHNIIKPISTKFDNVVTNNRNEFKKASNQETKRIDAIETMSFGEDKTSLPFPKTDQEKYNPNNAKIISENDTSNSHTYTLDDGRTIIYTKSGNNNLTLSQILTKNKEGLTLSIETYDNSGNQVTIKKYTYDKSNNISSIETKDNTTKTTTTEQITENGKTVKVTNANSKLLSLSTVDKNGTEISRQEYAYDYSGNLIAMSSYDSKTNTSKTDFYENNEKINSFPFAMNLSGTTKGYNSYFNYSDTTRLSEELSKILPKSEIDDINKAINNSVISAGKGTGESVAAVAVTLITELKKRGIVLPYYYGGGHEGNLECGVSGTLGSEMPPAAAGSQYRSKKSYDCSGFVRWCIETAGIECPSLLADGYISYGNRISSVKELKAGSLLANSQHVVMVIDTYSDKEGNNHIICAESTGSFATEAKYDTSNYKNTSPDYEGGVILTDKSESDISGYVKVDMESYYKENKK